MIQLSAKYTVARMMERNDFHQRFTDGSSISLHEFLYPCCRVMTPWPSRATRSWAARTRNSIC